MDVNYVLQALNEKLKIYATKIDFILLTVSLSNLLNDGIHKNTLRI